ncbi:hypothetical protein [Nostoc sp.]|uniref:hypothetical protein n=1 Tax=Nostoc sp. TaxID=1180 RepID=UPI002FFC1BF3
MPKPLDPKCQLCSKLPTTQAKLLHGPQGDGCWNPKVCHNRRSFYRHRSQNNAAEIDSVTVEPPATYFAVLYLYKEPVLLQDTRDRNSLLGPLISTDLFAGLVRTTMHLDLDDLIEPQTPQTFKPHGPHQFSSPTELGDSLAAPVEKANVLAMLDEVTTLEDVRNLASDEDVEKWQSAIAKYLINVKGEISLTQLQGGLKMPMVEVWLGLLLGCDSLLSESR